MPQAFSFPLIRPQYYMYNWKIESDGSLSNTYTQQGAGITGMTMYPYASSTNFGSQILPSTSGFIVYFSLNNNLELDSNTSATKFYYALYCKLNPAGSDYLSLIYYFGTSGPPTSSSVGIPSAGALPPQFFKDNSFDATGSTIPYPLVGSLNFNPTTKIIEIGATFNASTIIDIVPNILSKSVLNWSSDTTGVASINQTTGVITGVAAGSATITATANDGSGITGTIQVSVNKFITGLSFNPTSKIIGIGATFDASTFIAILPVDATDSALTWSSGTTSVATINQTTGVITGVAVGSATITATANDGSGITGTILIIVNKFITGLSFNPTSKNVYIGATFDASTIISKLPIDATDSALTWSSDTTSVATIDQTTGQITGVAAGSATITATAADGSGITATIQVSVTESTPNSNTCFVAGTPVNTDQGPIPIEELDHNTNTINGKPIVAISKITSTDSHIILLKANCLGTNQPCQDTTVSKLHKILYNGTMVLALNLPNVEQIPYDDQPLYNVLLENYGTMTVNNLTVETLHPRGNVAVLYKYITTNNIDTVEKNKLIASLNQKLELTNDLRKEFFSNIVLIIILNFLTEPKEEQVEVTPYSIIKAFLPNAAFISESNPLF